MKVAISLGFDRPVRDCAGGGAQNSIVHCSLSRCAWAAWVCFLGLGGIHFRGWGMRFELGVMLKIEGIRALELFLFGLRLRLQQVASSTHRFGFDLQGV